MYAVHIFFRNFLNRFLANLLFRAAISQVNLFRNFILFTLHRLFIAPSRQTEPLRCAAIYVSSNVPKCVIFAHVCALSACIQPLQQSSSRHRAVGGVINHSGEPLSGPGRQAQTDRHTRGAPDGGALENNTAGRVMVCRRANTAPPAADVARNGKQVSKPHRRRCLSLAGDNCLLKYGV